MLVGAWWCSGGWRCRERRMADHVHVSASSNLRATPGAPSSIALQRPRSPNPARRSGSGGSGAVAIHRRDPAEETKRFRLGREATRVEHRVERAVLTAGAPPRVFSPIATRAGDLVRGIATERDEVRHLGRIDAVALPHLGRADPGELAHAANRLENRHVAPLTSWNASRSEVATSAVAAGRFLSASTAAARKSSAS